MSETDLAKRARPRRRIIRLALGVSVAGLALGALGGCNTSSNGESPSVDYEAARFGSPEVDTADVANY